jgi:uncharacterized protein YecT (DUF1311 family)
MKTSKWAFLAGTVLSLQACTTGTPVACTADSAQEPVVQIVKQQLEKLIASKTKRDNGTQSVGYSKIRAAIGQLAISIADIRTSKTDPNSTKRFCTGNLKIRFTTEALNSAEQARSSAGSNTISDLADSEGVERNADSFSSSLDFNVQPTDDGKKVFAEIESGNSMFGFAADVLSSELLKTLIEDSKRSQQQAVDQQAAAQNVALAEQQNATLASAKVDNQLAMQTVTAAWKALLPSTRARLLPLQRAWIRKKDADCAVEAAAASIEPTAKEAARLTCDTRITKDRIGWLANYRDEGASTTSIPAPAGDEPSTSNP